MCMSLSCADDSSEHCHDDERREEFDKKARKKLWIASLLCVVFMVGEAVGKWRLDRQSLSLGSQNETICRMTDLTCFLFHRRWNTRWEFSGGNRRSPFTYRFCWFYDLTICSIHFSEAGNQEIELWLS